MEELLAAETARILGVLREGDRVRRLDDGAGSKYGQFIHAGSRGTVMRTHASTEGATPSASFVIVRWDDPDYGDRYCQVSCLELVW